LLFCSSGGASQAEAGKEGELTFEGKVWKREGVGLTKTSKKGKKKNLKMGGPHLGKNLDIVQGGNQDQP